VAQVVCVHGVGQQREAANTLLALWAPALCGGVKLAGGQLAENEVACGFYTDLFRPLGRHLGPGDPLIRPNDRGSFEEDLLAAWWDEAARTNAGVVSPATRTLGTGVPRMVQRALRALSGSRFFAGLSERALLGDLRQVHAYFTDPGIRTKARERVADVVGPHTRVLMGHSLGSVVAYEALCANPSWPIRMLVTVGSPLGVPNLIFDRLEPAPLAARTNGPRGHWPAPDLQWVNVTDEGDVVALVKDLGGTFGAGVECWLVDNSAKAHDARPYLTAVETGTAILKGLGGKPWADGGRDRM
jgi:hypothetical protein